MAQRGKHLCTYLTLLSILAGCSGQSEPSSSKSNYSPPTALAQSLPVGQVAEKDGESVAHESAVAGTALNTNGKPGRLSSPRGEPSRYLSLSSGSSSSHSSTYSSTTKSVHVSEYTRKDGTLVKSHDRSAPSRKSSGGSRKR